MISSARSASYFSARSQLLSSRYERHVSVELFGFIAAQKLGRHALKRYSVVLKDFPKLVPLVS